MNLAMLISMLLLATGVKARPGGGGLGQEHEVEGNEREVPLLAGHCGVTRVGSKCAAPGESGAWQTGPWAAQLGSLSSRKRDHQLLMRCLQECSRCDTCGYISFSLSQQDCSWYASCNMSQLTIAGDVVSARLDRTLLPPTRTTSPFLTPPRHQPRMQRLAAQRCPRNVLDRNTLPTPVRAHCLSPTTGRVTPAKGELPLYVQWEDYVPHYLKEVSNVSFVQVGANCGRNTKQCAVGGDPIWNYAASCGWRGIAIEPSPPTFTRLCTNYAALTPLVKPLNALITNAPGDAFISNNGEMSSQLLVPPTGAARDSAHRVAALRLADVWPKHGASVLVVDVEGSEEQILGSPLPLPLPHLVFFEHFNLHKDAKARIHANLLAHGFCFLKNLPETRVGIGKRYPHTDFLYGRLQAVKGEVTSGGKLTPHACP